MWHLMLFPVDLKLYCNIYIMRPLIINTYELDKHHSLVLACCVVPVYIVIWYFKADP